MGDTMHFYYNERGELHREDGPAVTHPDGYEAWYFNGLRHRENLPAINNPYNGYKAWYEHGVLIKEEM